METTRAASTGSRRPLVALSAQRNNSMRREKAIRPSRHQPRAVPSVGYALGRCTPATRGPSAVSGEAGVAELFPFVSTQAFNAPLDEPQRLFVDNLEDVDRIIGILARRYALPPDERDDFDSWAKLRLVEDDYAKLRKFRGESRFSTYLSTVLQYLFLDYRNNKWGRWRPSAAAERLGPLAIRLEELLYRDERPLREAIEVLRTAGVEESDSDLARLAARLPQRYRTDEVGVEEIDQAAVAAPPADAVLTGDAERLSEAVHGALRTLAATDRVITRMRFWDGMTVADIARALHMQQKPLYSRIEGILGALRSELEAAGVDCSRVEDVLSGVDES